ncbi:MAG: hypothetical protein RJA22_1299 [Verrucomicrobiota bacterium]
MVWQDSKVDGLGKGQGVMARKLSADLQPLGDAFVVSQRPVGHQETPSVAVLPDGAAVFAWLGPRHDSPDVHARLLGADGSFLSGDVQVTPPASRNLRQTRAVTMTGIRANRERTLNFRLLDTSRVLRGRNQGLSVTALPDGGSLVAYAGARRVHTNWQEVVRTEALVQGRVITNDLVRRRSESQDWMLDVFFQRLGADGRKLGGEVVVNQHARYNQHQPSVALLSNGTFVVVWVSETFVDSFRRNFEVYAGTPLLLAQVDVVGRVFAADGTPLTQEFMVNSVLRPCATPVVRALGEDGFLVAWAQRDGVRTNGWDIYTRTFDAEGQPESAAIRVNAHTYGDQYAPTLASAGSHHFVAWSSLGQDKLGSASSSWVQRDGSVVTLPLGRPASVPAVYGRAVAGGIPVGDEFRVNRSLTGKPMHPVVASDGSSRFVAVWSALGADGGYDLVSQGFSLPVPPANDPAMAAAQGSPAGGAVFRLSAAGSAEKLRLSWAGEAGGLYQIQTSTNLVDWTNVGEPRTAPGLDAITLPVGGSAGFYRVVKLP